MNDESGALDPDIELAREIAQFYADPLGHVLFSYPWGEEGTNLEKFPGPRAWQTDLLLDIGDQVAERGFNGSDPVEPLLYSTSSGHGIGKSAIVSWLIRWIMDTRPFAKGVVTATTNDQLRTKTWSELAKWHNMGITRHWFHLNSGAGSLNYYHKSYREQWRVDAQTSKEQNSESFAGLHAANSTPFYIFDEASGVPDKIFEVREGGLTDGEPMVFDFGNPTQNSGRFHANMAGRFRNLYRRRFINSEDVQGTNKKLFKTWADAYGRDSDFYKVRVLGQFPDAAAMQLIPGSYYDNNVDLDVAVSPTDVRVMGVDVARFGDDESVIWIRSGRDAATPGFWNYKGVDTMTLAGEVVEKAGEYNVDAVLIDGGGVGGGVIDACNAMGLDVIEINFGAKATMKGYHDMRSQMWGRMKKALKAGVRLPDDDDVRTDLTSLQYGWTLKNDLRLESKDDAKARGVASPDKADALALTYAIPIVPDSRTGGHKGEANQEEDYDPF